MKFLPRMWKKTTGRVFRRLVGSYVIIFLLPCIILGFVLWSNAATQLQKNAMDIVNNDITKLSQTISHQFEGMLDILTYVRTQGYNTNDEYLFMPYKWIDKKYAKTQIVWKLKELTETNPLIDKCFLIFRQHDMVFTTTTFRSIDVFFNERFLVSDSSILDTFLHSQAVSLVSSHATDTLTGNTGQMLFYTIPFNMEKVSQKDMALVFVTCEDTLLTFTKSIFGHPDFRARLFDAQGKLLISYGNYLHPEDAEASTPEGSTAFGIQQIGRRTVIVARDFVLQNRMDISIEVPINKEMQKLKDFYGFTLKLSLTVLLFGLLMSLFATWYNYRPLKNVMATLHIPTRDGERGRDEYQLMDAAIRNVLIENNKLEKKIDSQGASALQGVLFELLSGNILYDHIGEKIDVCDFLPGPWFFIAALSSRKEYTEEEIAKILHLTIAKASRYAIVDMPQYGCHAVVQCAPDEGGARRFISNLCHTIDGRDDLVVGVSNAYDDIRSLRRCMIEAYLVLDSMLEQGSCGITGFSEDTGLLLNLNHPSTQDIAALCQFLKSGDDFHAITLFYSMMDELRDNPNPIQQRIQQNRIVSISIETLHEINADNSTLIFDMFQCTLLHKDSSSNGLSDFRERFAEIIHRICDQVRNMEQERISHTYLQMIDYINLHYLDNDFSLEKFASQFGMSASAMSTAFKKNIGMNFINYITQKKMSTAKHMLLASKQSVSSISTQLGYANESYFIRVFSNIYGMTPAQFRKQCGIHFVSD